MSFRTPWKAPVKAGTRESGTADTAKIIEEFEATKGGLTCPPTDPSSPEGSKCTADSEDTQLPNSSECLKDNQVSNCSQPKIPCSKELPSVTLPSKALKDPEAFNSSKDSEHDDGDIDSLSSDNLTERYCKRNDKDKDFQAIDGKNNSQQAKGSKASKGSRKPKRCANSKDSAKNKHSQGSKCVKRPQASMKKGNISGASSSGDSTSSAEDIPPAKVSKSSFSKNSKDSKREEVSKKKSTGPDESESSSLEWSSSSDDESQRSSQMPSQATSLGSQFLKQEAPLVLSPPPAGLDARARLAWIQQRRITGVWVYCDNPQCNKQRYLADVFDPAVLPEKWFCLMNRDPERNTCEAAEVGPGIAEEEDMVVSAYTAGSLVWAKLDGYPEWPAMVDDDPDYEQYYWCSGYSDIPKDYHVTFFDSEAVTRAWLNPKQIRRFTSKETERKFSPSCMESLSRRLKASHGQAVQALSLTQLERLRKFSFIVRYKGKIGGERKPPPTPRRFMDKKKCYKKKTCNSGKSRKYGRPSKKNKLTEKKQGSQTKKQNEKSVYDWPSSESSEDEENPFTSDSSSISTDEGPPPSKKSNLVKPSKASSQQSSKEASKKFNPNFKACIKSPALTSPKSNVVKSASSKTLPVMPILAKSPTSTYNTATQESSQRSRKLWVDLDSSSGSEDDCKRAEEAQLPASGASEMESLVPRNNKQIMADDEPASEDSTLAFAGSTCSFALGVKPVCKPADSTLPESMDSDFIENTPVDLPSVSKSPEGKKEVTLPS